MWTKLTDMTFFSFFCHCDLLWFLDRIRNGFAVLCWYRLLHKLLAFHSDCVWLYLYCRPTHRICKTCVLLCDRSVENSGTDLLLFSTNDIHTTKNELKHSTNSHSLYTYVFQHFRCSFFIFHLIHMISILFFFNNNTNNKDHTFYKQGVRQLIICERLFTLTKNCFHILI